MGEERDVCWNVARVSWIPFETKLGRVSGWRRRSKWGTQTSSLTSQTSSFLDTCEKAHTYTNNNNMWKRTSDAVDATSSRAELAEIISDRIRSDQRIGLDSLPGSVRCFCCCCISYWIPFTTWIVFFVLLLLWPGALWCCSTGSGSLSLSLCLWLCSCVCVCALLQYHLAIDSLLRIVERCTRS